AVFADAAGIVLTNRKNLTIPAVDHKLGGAEVIVPPTLTENGIKVLYCEYCGEAYAEVEMAPVIANYIPGFFAESVEFVGTTIKVVSKVSAPEVDFAPIVAAGCTVELLEGDVEVVMDGTIPYFRSQYGVTAYSIKVTDADGAFVVYDVEVLYKEAPLTNESVLAGWAVDLYEVDADNDHITVYGIPFANTLDFALNIPGIAQDAIKLYNANGEEVAGIFDGGWQYLCANINDGLVQEFVAKVTTPGGVREISITYKFTTKTYFHDVEAGFFAADVKRAGDTVWLTAKEGAPEVDFRVFVAEWDAVVTSDDFEVITTGGFYPRAQRADGEYQEGTITITHTDGTYETFKVIVQF
ncbi:MAG: hypothetical protein IJ499_00160, partial [Clostridia bacterium]|nr:hypothetical protein [Clostridia bacterium]